MKPVPVENPPNPWATTEVEYLPELGEVPEIRLELFEDHTRQIISRNDSPDIGFDFSINPYRGCAHACAYCYARPSHEYLSLGAGTDFDRKIHFKPHAAQLLKEAFDRPSWKGEPLVFSGVTDCYQPLEASLRLTRSILEVCLEYRNPVYLITKAPLIERDLELLLQLHQQARVGVTVSIPFWDPSHARAIEPYVATPQRRMETVRRLSQAGLPVSVNIAPIIPGLNDEALAEILEAAAKAGAQGAGFVLLRLPGSTREVFEKRLREALPLRAERVLHRIRETRGGKLYDPRFGSRLRGEGRYAETIAQLFSVTARKLGLNQVRQWGPEQTTFRRPPKPGTQMELLPRE